MKSELVEVSILSSGSFARAASMADFQHSITSAKAKCSVAFVYRLFLSKHSVCLSCSSTKKQ